MNDERLSIMADLAKLDALEQKFRADLDDPMVKLEDVAALKHAASIFGVSIRHSYLRAKGLWLLSYQVKGISEEDEKAWQDRMNAWRFGGEDAEMDAIYAEVTA